jgi:hypothetical protein
MEDATGKKNENSGGSRCAEAPFGEEKRRRKALSPPLQRKNETFCRR